MQVGGHKQGQFRDRSARGLSPRRQGSSFSLFFLLFPSFPLSSLPFLFFSFLFPLFPSLPSLPFPSFSLLPDPLSLSFSLSFSSHSLLSSPFTLLLLRRRWLPCSTAGYPAPPPAPPEAASQQPPPPPLLRRRQLPCAAAQSPSRPRSQPPPPSLTAVSTFLFDFWHLLLRSGDFFPSLFILSTGWSLELYLGLDTYCRY